KANIEGNYLTTTGPGSVVIKASQPGNERFEPAEAEHSILVFKARQTIHFDALPNDVFVGDSFPVRATTTSGLPVNITVVAGPAEIVDGQLSVHGADEVKLKASQSGNENHAPAPDVVHTLSVVKVGQTIQFDLGREELPIGESLVTTAAASSG